MLKKDVIWFAVVWAACGMSGPRLSGEARDGSGAIRISEGVQLFLDDYLISKMENLKREIQRPTKHPGNPVLVGEYPWEQRFIEIYGTVLYDPTVEKFRCWYLANEFKDGIPDTPEGVRTAEYYVCYSESENGIRWVKPMVGEGKFGVHEKHNVVIPGGHGFCVLATPEDVNPKRRFKGAGGRSFGFSEDGLHWTLRDWNAVGKNDTGTSLIRWNREYLAYVRYQIKDPDWPGVMRGVGISVSQDFERWTPKALVFRSDASDGYPWSQPYGMSVTAYGAQLIGLLWFLHLDRTAGNNSLGDMDVQLAVSRDGRAWDRVANRATFLSPTPGTWDAGRVFPGTTMFVKDDRLFIYYTGTDTRHGSGSWGKTGIGLATLEADRFVAIRQVDSKKAGVLETRVMQLTGNTLIVNAKGGPGTLAVEVLDENGRIVPGFAREQSRLMTRDELRYQVVWGEGDGPRSLGSARLRRAVALRFIIHGGSLFGFQVIP